MRLTLQTPEKTPDSRFGTTGSDVALGKIFAVDDGSPMAHVNHEGDADEATGRCTVRPTGHASLRYPARQRTSPTSTSLPIPPRFQQRPLPPRERGPHRHRRSRDDGPRGRRPRHWPRLPARFTGAHYDSVDDLFWLADDSGHLYSAAPGFAAWTRNDTAYKASPADDAPVLPFTDFAAVPQSAQTVLLVGTSGYGYRVIGDVSSVTPLPACLHPWSTGRTTNRALLPRRA